MPSIHEELPFAINMIEQAYKIGLALLGIGLPILTLWACLLGIKDDHKR
jgi:hypothetical protein